MIGSDDATIVWIVALENKYGSRPDSASDNDINISKRSITFHFSHNSYCYAVRVCLLLSNDLLTAFIVFLLLFVGVSTSHFHCLCRFIAVRGLVLTSLRVSQTLVSSIDHTCLIDMDGMMDGCMSISCMRHLSFARDMTSSASFFGGFHIRLSSSLPLISQMMMSRSIVSRLEG